MSSWMSRCWIADFFRFVAMSVAARHLGGNGEMQRRFDGSVPRVPPKSIHASRPFREMIARPKVSRNEWDTAEIGAFEVGNVALSSVAARRQRPSADRSRQRAATRRQLRRRDRARMRRWTIMNHQENVARNDARTMAAAASRRRASARRPASPATLSAWSARRAGARATRLSWRARSARQRFRVWIHARQRRWTSRSAHATDASRRRTTTCVRAGSVRRRRRRASANVRSRRKASRFGFRSACVAKTRRSAAKRKRRASAAWRRQPRSRRRSARSRKRPAWRAALASSRLCPRTIAAHFAKQRRPAPQSAWRRRS